MEAYIGSISPALMNTIVRVVKQYSVSDPISRGGLVNIVQRQGFKTTERTVREAIKQLRRAGYLICSAPGTNGGYYTAKTAREYEEFKHRELMAKVEDMLMTVRCMDKAAEREFGSAQQIGLF